MNNTKQYIAVLLFLLGVNISPEALAQESRMSIEQCLEYALLNNAVLKNSRLDIKDAQAEIKAITGLGLPQINAEAGLNYNFKVATQFLPDFISPSVYGVLFDEMVIPEKSLGDPAILPAQFGTKYSGNASVSLSQMIFNGSYFIGLEAARSYSKLADEQAELKVADVKANVKKAAFATLVNAERKSLLNGNIKQLDQLIKETEAMYKEGFVEKTDVDRLKVNRNNLRVERQNANNMYELSLLALKLQMGMPIKEEIYLTDSLKETLVSPESLKQAKVEYSKVPEFKVLSVQRELADLDVRNNKIKRFPMVNAFVSVGSNSGAQSFNDALNFSDNWFGNGITGVSIKWNLLDGFARKHRIDQARMRVQQVENGMESMEQAIDMQVQQAALNLINAYESVQVQKESMALAKEVLRVSKIKYLEGVGSNLEVTSSETDLKTSQTNYYAALYQLLVAKVDYERVSGLI